MSLHDEPRMQAIIEAYFNSLNTEDEASYKSIFAHDVEFFGSASGIHSTGIATLLGVWRGARKDLLWRTVKPIEVFGRWPEAAALVEIVAGETANLKSVHGIWHFTFNDDWRIQKLSVLWDFWHLIHH